MDKLYVIKIGGEVVDDASTLEVFLQQFSSISSKKILVHGGGKLATELAMKLGLTHEMIEGRRVTDAETLKVTAMVYAGLINKQIVATLQSEGVNAFGLTGVDGNLLLAHKRIGQVDYGFAGDIDVVNVSLMRDLLGRELIPVIAPLTHDGRGQLLNTNADTIAKTIAASLVPYFNVHLLYSFNKPGVLNNADDDSSVIPSLKYDDYNKLKEQKRVFAGMIPKLDNAFEALNAGIQKLSVGHATQLLDIIRGEAGTEIING